MTKRFPTLGRWAMLASLALLLTGCLKLDMKLDIQADDTVDGSVVFAVNKDVLSLTGGSFADLIGDQTPFPSDMQGVTSEDYDDGEFVGQRYTFEGVGLDEFGDPTGGESLEIKHEGDTFTVNGVMDLSQGLSGVTGATGFDPSTMMQSAELRIAMSFPGDVKESNGDVDGNTVVWTPKFGERLELHATASAVASGGDSWTLVFVLIGIAVVALIAAIVILLNRRKTATAPGGGPTEEPSTVVAPEPTTPAVAAPEPTTPPPPAAPEPTTPPPPAAPEPPPTAPPDVPPPVAPPPPSEE